MSVLNAVGFCLGCSNGSSPEVSASCYSSTGTCHDNPSSARIKAACLWCSMCCLSNTVSASSSSSCASRSDSSAPTPSSTSVSRSLGLGTLRAYSFAFWCFETAVGAGAAAALTGCRSSSCCLLITRRFLEKIFTRSALALFATSSSVFRSGFRFPRRTYSLETFPVYGLYSTFPRFAPPLSSILLSAVCGACWPCSSMRA
mmetsp:Transcript_2319/g.5780  ORF Transcript_2319/g.5780 Transcript_2319/m.5780 type:complete len:201 (-) Transcript_2319:32-634(-)